MRFEPHNLLSTGGAGFVGTNRPAPRSHHVSTDDVYGSPAVDAARVHESTPYAPNSPCSATKAASDQLVRAYHEIYGLNSRMTNCSDSYGPYQFPKKLIPLVIINILRGKPLRVYGDGGQIRNWSHIGDHCRATGLVQRHGTCGNVYNVGGNSETTNIDIVKARCVVVDENFARHPEWQASFPRFARNQKCAGGRLNRLRARLSGPRPPPCPRLPQGGARVRLQAGSRSGAEFAIGARMAFGQHGRVAGAARARLFSVD